MVPNHTTHYICSAKKLFWKIPQNSQKKNCLRKVFNETDVRNIFPWTFAKFFRSASVQKTSGWQPEYCEIFINTSSGSCFWTSFVTNSLSWSMPGDQNSKINKVEYFISDYYFKIYTFVYVIYGIVSELVNSCKKYKQQKQRFADVLQNRCSRNV